MDQSDHKKKRQRVSNFADPYSLHGQEKYPLCKMPRKSKFATTKTESKKLKKEKSYKERDESEPGCSASSSANAHHSEWQVEPSSDEYEAYKEILYQCSAYAALNEKLTAFAILDYDFPNNILKKSSPCLVFRQGEHFLCTCDNLRRSYLENVGNCSVEESSIYHKPCYHSRIVKELYETYIYSNSIDLDHEYSSMERKEDEPGLSEVCEITFMEDVFAVYSAKMYGLVKVTFGSLKCLTCPLNCSHPSHLEKILKKFGNDDCPDIIEKINTRLSKNSNSYQLQCHSVKKISFELPVHLRTRIQQIPDDVFKAVNRISNCPVCQASLKEEEVQSIQDCLFLSNYKMLKFQCYNKVCSNVQCGHISHYDGQDDCILNMGKFLVHYEVLRNYMYLFLYSGCTMYSFYNTWKAHQRDVGNHSFPEKFPYSCFRWTWYSYIQLLDIDPNQTFYCDEPGCGMHPSILLFDGTTLSFQRSFLHHLEIPNEVQAATTKVKGSHKDRIFLANVDARNLLKNFVTTKSINQHEFTVMKEVIKDHQPSLVQLLEHLEEIGCTTSCPEEMRGLLLSLSCSSAVCATFHQQDIGFIQEILQEKLTPERKFQLQIRIPTLFELLSPLDYIPKYLRPILTEIISIVERTFSLPKCDTELIENHADYNDELSFFPNFPKVRQRGFYAMDKVKGEMICTKKSSRHSSLLPGVFTVFCPHGICYGFEVMECAESPNRPFSLLKTRFEEPPDVIIYDNSCNLHNYVLNRDPTYFAKTLFVVDTLHWDNHTACSQGYRAHSYPLLRNINTQIVEQNNAKLRKLKASLSYMKPENFMNTLKFFLWFCNDEVKRKRKC